MSDPAIAHKSDARRVLLTGNASPGSAADRQLALAWVRLAGQVAPPGAILCGWQCRSARHHARAG